MNIQRSLKSGLLPTPLRYNGGKIGKILEVKLPSCPTCGMQFTYNRLEQPCIYSFKKKQLDWMAGEWYLIMKHKFPMVWTHVPRSVAINQGIPDICWTTT